MGDATAPHYVAEADQIRTIVQSALDDDHSKASKEYERFKGSVSGYSQSAGMHSKIFIAHTSY